MQLSLYCWSLHQDHNQSIQLFSWALPEYSPLNFRLSCTDWGVSSLWPFLRPFWFWSLEIFRLPVTYFINESSYEVWLYPSVRFAFLTSISSSESPLQELCLDMLQHRRTPPFIGWGSAFGSWLTCRIEITTLTPYSRTNLCCPLWAVTLSL